MTYAVHAEAHAVIQERTGIRALHADALRLKNATRRPLRTKNGEFWSTKLVVTRKRVTTCSPPPSTNLPHMSPFQPASLPLDNLPWEQLIEPMGKANRYIARYDGLLQSIVNPDVLLSSLRTQEAVLSSKIEGSQATLREVLQFDAEGRANASARAGDIEEVINYRVALLKGRQKMEHHPLTLNVIKVMHGILMQGVRGSGRDPGNFRRLQNWIGVPGSTIQTARFVPPTVSSMHEALDSWEKYLHTDDKDVMVQLAVVHAQFEIIHPFIDGNGRIGRILIPLFLYHKQILHQPMFYMSQYLEQNRQAYYDHLKHITDTGDWTRWIKFFLEGIVEQAEKNITQTRKIIEAYDSMKVQLAYTTKSQWAIQCLDYIFSNPYFNSTDFKQRGGVPKTSAMRLLNIMEQGGIIQKVTQGAGRKPGLYIFPKLWDIIE